LDSVEGLGMPRPKENPGFASWGAGAFDGILGGMAGAPGSEFGGFEERPPRANRGFPSSASGALEGPRPKEKPGFPSSGLEEPEGRKSAPSGAGFWARDEKPALAP
jgi:hypothetical protein